MAEPEPEAVAGLASKSLVNQAPGEVEKKYDVLAVNLVCTWKFGDGFTDTCAICKASLYEASLDCQAHNIEDKKHDGWHLCTGVCGHAFHYDCIKKFTQRGRNNCPVCNAPWEEKSVVAISSMNDA